MTAAVALTSAAGVAAPEAAADSGGGGYGRGRLLLYVVGVGVGGGPLQPRRRGWHWLPFRFCCRDCCTVIVEFDTSLDLFKFNGSAILTDNLTES